MSTRASHFSQRDERVVRRAQLALVAPRAVGHPDDASAFVASDNFQRRSNGHVHFAKCKKRFF
jgi:hypothetical protein